MKKHEWKFRPQEYRLQGASNQSYSAATSAAPMQHRLITATGQEIPPRFANWGYTPAPVSASQYAIKKIAITQKL